MHLVISGIYESIIRLTVTLPCKPYVGYASFSLYMAVVVVLLLVVLLVVVVVAVIVLVLLLWLVVVAHS